MTHPRLCSLLRKHSAFMYLEYFCEYKIHARAFTFIYLSSNVCSTRNDRSIDRLASGPQIKRSFLRAMFASQTIWRLPTIFLFTVILICALSFNGSCKMRAVFTGEPRKTNYFAINLFLQTRSLDATREVFTSEFTLWMWTVYREPSLEI